MTEVMAGRIDFFFVAASAALANVRQGKLTALAVNGAARSAALPNVPTISEAGFSNAEYPLWFGLFLPARTPREIVDRLHRETVAALKQSKVKDKLAALGGRSHDVVVQGVRRVGRKGYRRRLSTGRALGLKSQ